MSEELDYGISFLTNTGSRATVFIPSSKLHRRIADYALMTAKDYDDVIMEAIITYLDLVDNKIESSIRKARIAALKAELETLEADEAEANLHE